MTLILKILLKKYFQPAVQDLAINPLKTFHTTV
jgi:hypothetical protein